MRESKIRSFVSGEEVWVGEEPQHPVRVVSGKFLNYTTVYGGPPVPVSIARGFVLPRMPSSLIGTSRVSLRAITPGVLEQLDPEDVAYCAAEDAVEAIYEMIELQAMPLEYRVPQVLLLLADETGRIDCNQEQIAQVCGINRGTVSAVLRPLNEQEIVWTRYGQIRIKDRERLIKASGPPESFRTEPPCAGS